MNTTFSDTKFYKELESSLATSTGEQRKVWAITIVKKDVDIKVLANLLKGEEKAAMRFRWLLSDIGLVDPNKLLKALPFLLDFSADLNSIDKTSFANWWLIAGVPPENESEAIDLAFYWLLSPNINVTIKSRAVFVLFNLTKKYPELKNELKLCLQDQMDKHSKDFKKRATKILLEMEQ